MKRYKVTDPLCTHGVLAVIVEAEEDFEAVEIAFPLITGSEMSEVDDAVVDETVNSFDVEEIKSPGWEINKIKRLGWYVCKAGRIAEESDLYLHNDCNAYHNCLGDDDHTGWFDSKKEAKKMLKKFRKTKE